MKFCPKCGTLLLPRKDAKGTMLACPNCKYVDKADKAATVKVSTQVTNKKIVEIVEDNDAEATLPVVEIKCEKCGNNKAHYWLTQTRAGDEPETRFYKCTACKHTWREYD
jgi:DNA-directed RNA polymerase subunit M